MASPVDRRRIGTGVDYGVVTSHRKEAAWKPSSPIWIGRFERGACTRRELVGALALIAGAGTAASAATLKSASINHVSVLVTDMARSIEFYGRVFGLTLVNEDKANKIARLGAGGKVLVSLRVEPPPGLIDHFAIGVDGYNREAVTADLKGFGLDAGREHRVRIPREGSRRRGRPDHRSLISNVEGGLKTAVYICGWLSGRRPRLSSGIQGNAPRS